MDTCGQRLFRKRGSSQTGGVCWGGGGKFNTNGAVNNGGSCILNSREGKKVCKKGSGEGSKGGRVQRMGKPGHQGWLGRGPQTWSFSKTTAECAHGGEKKERGRKGGKMRPDRTGELVTESPDGGIMNVSVMTSSGGGPCVGVGLVEFLWSGQKLFRVLGGGWGCLFGGLLVPVGSWEGGGGLWGVVGGLLCVWNDCSRTGTGTTGNKME